LVVVCVLLIHFGRCTKRINYGTFDEGKLHTLSAAIDLYENKYGDLPPEADFRNLLLDDELVPNENVFYSGNTKIKIRYFHHENKFVLVSPGQTKNTIRQKAMKILKNSKKKPMI